MFVLLMLMNSQGMCEPGLTYTATSCTGLLPAPQLSSISLARPDLWRLRRGDQEWNTIWKALMISLVPYLLFGSIISELWLEFEFLEPCKEVWIEISVFRTIPNDSLVMIQSKEFSPLVGWKHIIYQNVVSSTVLPAEMVFLKWNHKKSRCSTREFSV